MEMIKISERRRNDEKNTSNSMNAVGMIDCFPGAVLSVPGSSHTRERDGREVMDGGKRKVKTEGIRLKRSGKRQQGRETKVDRFEIGMDDHGHLKRNARRGNGGRAKEEEDEEEDEYDDDDDDDESVIEFDRQV